MNLKIELLEQQLSDLKLQQRLSSAKLTIAKEELRSIDRYLENAEKEFVDILKSLVSLKLPIGS